MTKIRRFAWLGILAMIALTIVGALNLRHLQTQYSVMQFLPAHHPALEMEKEVRDTFHLSDAPVFIGLISLPESEKGTWLEKSRMQRLSDLTEKMKSTAGVSESLSIATVGGASDVDGVLNVGPLISMTPEKKWAQRILNDKLFTPNLISKDARTVLLYSQLQNANVDLLVQFESQFRQNLHEAFPEAKVSIGGVPAIQTDLGLLLDKELGNFLILTVLVCALTLLAIFRSVSTLFIPLILTAFCNVMVLAVMAWTGLTFTVLSTTIPVIVFITVVSLTTHSLLKVNENFNHGVGGEAGAFAKWKLIWQSNREILLPNFLGALTTCVGFLTLLFGKVPLIRDYGMSVALAVVLSWALSSLAIVPLLVLFPLPQPREWVRRPARWALWAIKKNKSVVIGVTVLVLSLTFIGRHLNWTGRLFDDLPAGQEARKATEQIDATMGGVIPLEIVLKSKDETAWKNPQQLQKLDQLMSELRDINGVGSVHGLPDFLKALESKEGGRIPASVGGVTEIYFLYSLSASNILENYLSADAKSTRVELKVHDLPSNEMTALIESLKQKAESVFPGTEVSLGGMGSVVHLIHDELSTELIFGFWQALALIVILLAFIFRSARWALVAILPNLVPPVALLGYLALTGTAIKPGVAIIFSIALGLAFNNTVYLLNRIKALYQKKDQKALPIRRSFYLEGNPCLVSTLIVMTGFSVFLFSYFSLNQTFGACMVVSIIAGMVGDLIFLPALLTLFPNLLSEQKSPAFLQGRWRELTGRKGSVDLDVGEI